MDVAKSPHWLALPDGPTTKNEQCSPEAKMQILKSKSKKGGGAFFCKEGSFFWQSRSFFVKVRHFSCNKGKKLHKKGLYLRMSTNPYGKSYNFSVTPPPQKKCQKIGRQEQSILSQRLMSRWKYQFSYNH